MLSPAAISTAVQRVARARHESDDTAVLARAVLQLLCQVERLGVDDRTLAFELRKTKASLRRLRTKTTPRPRPVIRIRAE